MDPSCNYSRGGYDVSITTNAKEEEQDWGKNSPKNKKTTAHFTVGIENSFGSHVLITGEDNDDFRAMHFVKTTAHMQGVSSGGLFILRDFVIMVAQHVNGSE
jgi:hypothetical protein